MDEKIRFDFNPDAAKLKEALKFVRQYVIKTNSILVGGMALDSALQLKGTRIYDPEVTIPDYDFMHPDSVNISYDLVKIVQKMFQDSHVDVVRAVHTTTMRVRLNWVVIADITYVPKNIFDKIYIIEFKGMKIIHPSYTIMDQLDALSRPYINPPREVVTHRWKKDWTRMQLINTYYGIGPTTVKNDVQYSGHSHPFCKDFSKFMSKIRTSGDSCKSLVVTGVSGLAFLFRAKKYQNEFPVIFDKSNDTLVASDKKFARLSLMIGDAPAKWWKNIRLHKFTKSATKFTWFNESLSYPHRIEIEFDDFTLELVYMNYNCLTYVDVTDARQVHPLVGCVWTMLSSCLIQGISEYEPLLTNIMKTYLFAPEATSIKQDHKLSVIAADTGPLISPSMRLNLEYHHTRTEHKRLKNKKLILVPGSWDGSGSIPNKFNYSKSYYYTVLDAASITSTEFNSSIESLEILSRYLDIKTLL
jgi:hypothetical protein